MRPTYFATPAKFRAWLEKHHSSEPELLVGFWKKHTGEPSIDWPQARDQALCFGWIDGVRKSLGPDSYTIRFTPRRPGSIWSKVNLARFEALKAEGAMTPAGEAAFAASKENRSNYAYEADVRELAPEQIEQFKANARAWADWEKRPPSYRKVVTHWVTSAKRPETQARRLATLIEDSAHGRQVGPVDIGRKRS
jgi:uncharacterized protein YdeI (YjbR/CyaY-like superfamily)